MFKGLMLCVPRNIQISRFASFHQVNLLLVGVMMVDGLFGKKERGGLSKSFEEMKLVRFCK